MKVISKWKAPSEIINRIIVCHFAPKIGRRRVSGPLPVISLVFDCCPLALCWTRQWEQAATEVSSFKSVKFKENSSLLTI